MKCRNCKKPLKWPYFSVWVSNNGTKGWFCSSKCCREYCGSSGTQNGGINGCVTALVMLPFVLAFKIIKLPFIIIGKIFKAIFGKKKENDD